MKKNRKKFNLHDLAGQVEKMSLSEQKSSAGGDMYFTPDGQCLGEYGQGSSLQVISQRDFDHYKNYGESGLNNFAIVFSEAGYEAQSRIASAMAGQACRIYDNPQDPTEHGNTGYAYDPLTGALIPTSIGLNYNGQVVQSNNYWDILSIIVHEKCHYSLGYNDTWDGRYAEYMCLQAQFNDPNFSRCSQNFQDAMRRAEHYTLFGYYN